MPLSIDPSHAWNVSIGHSAHGQVEYTKSSRNIKKPFCHRQVRYRVGRFRLSKDLDSISNFQPTLTKIEVLTQCQAPTWITPPREPVRPKILSTSSDDLWTAAA